MALSVEEINARLKEKGFTHAKLARRWRRSQSTVFYLVRGRIKSALLRKQLAAILEVPIEDIPQPGEPDQRKVS